MPRLIFKCPYLKGGGENAARLGNYVRYMATREGVDKLTPGHAGWRATKKQKELIDRLLHDFPMARGMFEYEDYLDAPTRANASEFITRCMEDNLGIGGPMRAQRSGSHGERRSSGMIELSAPAGSERYGACDDAAKRENYVDYIAQRPRAERLGQHGLFTGADGPITLSQAADEVAHHPGNVWLPILSLRREDAARLGFDNAQRWRTLLNEFAPRMAEAMKIPLEQFRWYAAYHDEGHHPHVHMVVYSADGRSGYLTRKGITEIKSKLVKEIFAGELTELYQRQTMRRDELTALARSSMERAIREMRAGTMDNARIEQLTDHLFRQLQTVTGKKQYGYLKPTLKATVDEIVDELAKDPRIASAYDLWYQLREKVLHSYKDDLPERLPLSRQKEFKQVRNVVVQEALRLGQMEMPEEQIPDPPLPDAPAPEEPPDDGDAPTPNVTWSEEYRQARAYLYGSEEQPPDFGEAYALFLLEAESGNALAMCDLGRMWADGLGRDPAPEDAQRWYAKALAVFLSVEAQAPDRYTQYRIGKLYAQGLGTEQDYAEAARWFGMAAEQGHKYAQYSLGGLYLRGQGTVQSDVDAYRLYNASAQQGFPYAAFELGKLLRDGRGCGQDATAADEWFRRAYQGFAGLERQSHDDKLQYRLGWMLLHGVGVGRDEAAAKSWFEKAARLDNPHAQYQLAKLILSDPASDAQMVEQAVEWLTKAADAGQDCAQYALGKLYRDGAAVEKDILQAVIWFSAAAEKDNSYAAYALGKLYLTGEDVPKDMEKALRWLQRSADLGNEYAQYQLGKLYLLGKEVEKDEEAAVRWLTLSAAQGNEYAQWFLDHLGEFRGPTPFQCATRLLHHMSRIFQEQTPRPPMRVEVDSKLRRRIREKKIAMGHRPDDHDQKI